MKVTVDPMKDVRDALFVAQRSDGTLVRRPLSPHLQVYRFQLSMFLSIANRIAGVASSIGTLLLVWWLVAAATGPASFATVQAVVGSPVGLIALFGWTLALVYHLVAGLRHLAWDAGYGFDKASFNKVGPIAVVVTLVLTVLLFAIGLSFWMHAPMPASAAGN